ncbi:DUF6677 family protein [Cohnella kolymensis]|uniref:DUF6677 family protein n=1 Tax=Cohnella kolymensis TaxID=1590652 RepID=UPI0006975FDE|nr:TM2 domain-containing protein [Cohnella kolymensis]
MNEQDRGMNGQSYQSPPGPDAHEQQQHGYPGYSMPQGHPYDPGRYSRKKSKWLAGLLAFLIPGIGHFYLGQMIKGLVFMLLIALNITAIVYVSIEGENVLSIVLLSLLLPIIYFYNLFDALQSTDNVNDRFTATGGWTPQSGWTAAPPEAVRSGTKGITAGSILFLGAAAIIVLMMTDISWNRWLFNSSGSIIGAVLLIAAGAGLWLWEMRGHHGPKQ